MQAQNAAPHSALSAAAFPYDPQRFAVFYLKGNAVHRLYKRLFEAELEFFLLFGLLFALRRFFRSGLLALFGFFLCVFRLLRGNLSQLPFLTNEEMLF